MPADNESVNLNLAGPDPVGAIAAAVQVIYVAGRETMSQANRDGWDALFLKIATDAYEDGNEAKQWIKAAIKRLLEPKP